MESIFMKKKKVGILAECVCDLPKSLLKENDVDILYFLIETENGVFTDSDEITSENVIYYLETGGQKTKSSPPPSDVYFRHFTDNLKKYDDVILVAISSQISYSCKNAQDAVNMMGAEGSRVHIFDSQHLSTGLGFFVLRAAELANEGCGYEEIIEALEELRPRVSTSFIAKNADYLYRNGLVSSLVKKICSTFHIHPVLEMQKGMLKLKTILVGSYDSSCKTYIRLKLKGQKNIDTRCGFITHAGCSVKTLRMITAETEQYCHFEELKVTNASATISGNCGPDTFGVLFVRNNKS